jgi:hypothetical protein
MMPFDGSTQAAPARSSRREVRNPLLALPAAKAIAALPLEQRQLLGQLLRELNVDCEAKAQKAWTTKKGPMAAYWKACAVYAKHAGRLCGPPARKRRPAR